VAAAEEEKRVEHLQVLRRSLRREERRHPAVHGAEEERRQPLIERRLTVPAQQPPRRRGASLALVADLDDMARRIREVADRLPGVRVALGAVLDRAERAGRLPRRFTVAADPATATALAVLFSARAVAPAGAGRVRLDLALAAAGLPLTDLLYRALERAPRDPTAEAAALRAAARAALTAALADRAPASEAALGFVRAAAAALEAGRGELAALAADRGPAAAAAEVVLLARLLDAAVANAAPVRRATFAARIAGDSKALTRDRVRLLGHALLDHHPAILDAVMSDPRADDPAAWPRLALEACGVTRDEAALTAYCFGPLVYHKGAERFDQVARHAARGEVSALTLPQLRGARFEPLSGARVFVVENQAPFLELCDALAARALRDVAVLARGHASWAVVQLVRHLAAAGGRVHFAGDLDRSGVLILRSLSQRALARVTPIAMDRATFDRARAHGRPLSPGERDRLADLLAHDAPRAPCNDLLRAIADADRWIEQETFFAEAVLTLLEHPDLPA
jgi:hypothetical protein